MISCKRLVPQKTTTKISTTTTTTGLTGGLGVTRVTVVGTEGGEEGKEGRRKKEEKKEEKKFSHTGRMDQPKVVQEVIADLKSYEI